MNVSDAIVPVVLCKQQDAHRIVQILHLDQVECSIRAQRFCEGAWGRRRLDAFKPGVLF